MTRITNQLWVFAAASLLTLYGQIVFADMETEYSRITAGGRQSTGGRYRVDDAITLSSSGTEQKGNRYEVKSIKNAEQTTAVKSWKGY